MTWQSYISPSTIIQDDSTPTTVVPGNVARGYDQPRDWSENGLCSGFGSEPFTLPMLTEQEARELIKEREQLVSTNRLQLKRFGHRRKNQNGLGYCHVYSVTNAFEGQLGFQNPSAKVPVLSPESVGAPVTGFKNRGSWPSKNCAYAAEHGFALQEHWPKHLYHNGKMNDPKVLEDRKRFRILKWIDIDTRDREQGWWQAICASLAGFLVAVGQMHWSHSVMLTDPKINSKGEIGNEIENQWANWGDDGHGHQFGSKKYFDEACVIYQVQGE